MTRNPFGFCTIKHCLLALLLATGLGTVQAQPPKAAPGDPVAIETGKVAGTLLNGGVRAFFGIPFAAPPLAELRWHEPMPVKPWSGIYDATAPKPACAQKPSGDRAPTDQYSEDCLFVNVWAPAGAKPGDKLPVIVYIYGGAFAGGSINIPNYSGAQLARKGVVTVNIAYRVGIFGYFAHPDLSKESGHNASGDWGSLDQVAGLKWVQRNVAAFGGDPANVLLMGHSAGSESVYQLQASPLARGLFTKLSGWSGANLAPGGQIPRSLAEGEASGIKLQQALNAASIADLRAIPWPKLIEAIAPLSGAPGAPGALQTRPIVDGYFLPDQPDKIFKAGKHNDAPLLASSTISDLGSATAFYAGVKTLADLQAAAQSAFGDDAHEFLKLFPAASDEAAQQVARLVSGDTGFGLVARDWARDQALHGKQPAYLVQWAHVPPPNPTGNQPPVMFGIGPSHGTDIPYWLGTFVTSTNRSWTPWDMELSARMQDVLIAFAKTGSPSTAEVKIPRYDPGNEQRIVFGDAITLDKLDTAQIEFLRAHPPARPRPAAAR